MDLTDEEVKIIEQFRQSKKSQPDHQKRTLHLLQRAASFERWMQETGAGATYSAFCDDYGYQGEDRPVLYEQVLQVIAKARKLTVDNSL